MSGQIPLLGIAADGMEAQRAALDVEARNVASAEAAGPRAPFTRLVPQFETVSTADGSSIAFTGTRPDRVGSGDVLTEMVAIVRASRAYEANASVFDLGKRLAERTIDMARL